MDIGYYMIFGKPLFTYFGGLAILGFLITAVIPNFLRWGIKIDNPIKWHKRVAYASIALALTHILLVLSASL